ncbi:putative deoxyribonuclease YabD [Propionispora sp. 2/2-37]|uniref:TatD family hydrolase n=1 Tax=Propionispora sp. 2/2-37 TaxID=1677858 RepID=UPI0006BB8C42|nr:TatD family hydrolase [Propionispora sp. 2/2-37]CUH95450.1 putative deoxyribonuclease YabD [Propionispora sp. 2/2-37]
MLFDSHAHIDDEKFAMEQDNIVARALANEVTGIINVGACMESSRRSLELSRKYPQVYAAVGIHPHDAKEAKRKDYEQLALWAAEPKVVAIGEIGLDYYYDFSPRDVQEVVFVRQLEVARQCNKPVIIHDRDAHQDTMHILKHEGKGVCGVLHCFSGSLEMAKELMKMGFYISFGGPITFKNSVKLKEIACQVPLDRLLVETDSPYLTPHPYRGKRNEPAYVRIVAEEIARLRNMDLTELARITSDNVRKLFRIPPVGN